MKVIEIKNLTKIYNGSSVQVTAVDNVDLVIEEGEFTLLAHRLQTTLEHDWRTRFSTSGEIGGIQISPHNSKQLVDFGYTTSGVCSSGLQPDTYYCGRNISFIMRCRET